MFVRRLVSLGVGRDGRFGSDDRARLPGKGGPRRANVKLLSAAVLFCLARHRPPSLGSTAQRKVRSHALPPSPSRNRPGAVCPVPAWR
jgi:hypothetical protein